MMYADLVMTNEVIQPLRDVWLRPRRVFRELAPQPVGTADYVLAAAQGVAASIAVYHSSLAAVRPTAGEILKTATLFGPIAGIASVFLFAALYTKLSARSGRTVERSQVFHVLAYGGIPVVATLLLWAVAAAFVGEAAIVPAAADDTDGFVTVILTVQSLGYTFLLLWSVVLQVMGFSEIQGVATGKAFGTWVVGQLIVVAAAFLLAVIVSALFAGTAAGFAP
jgi:hypothetical protein